MEDFSMLRAIIFDMGGTLLRFARPGNGTWREFELPGIRGIYQYLIEQGHPIASREDEFVEVMFERLAEGWMQSTGGHINLRAVDWIATGAADHALNLDEAALLEAARHYAHSLRIGLSAVPGAVDMLAVLRERGYRMGLISNTIWPAELHLEDLVELGILPYLEHTIFSGDFGVWKPNPRVFQHMMEILDVRPEEAVFVGDSPREDILGAQRVGMRAIWLRSQEFPLGDIRPDAIIETLPDLLKVLEYWRTD
jgi:putative hydrolase of the HAD superfamily